MLRQIVPSTDEIYQQDLAKDLFSALYLTFYHQKPGKTAMLRYFAESIDNSYQWDFPKVVVLKYFTKGAICSSFRGTPYT